MGIITRMIRSSMVEALSQDYMRTARAKGARRRTVVYRHALRNAFIPTLTLLGLAFGSLLSGAVLTETIFSWQGIGSYATKTASLLDYPAIMGVALVTAVVYVFVNLLVDVLYGVVNPADSSTLMHTGDHRRWHLAIMGQPLKMKKLFRSADAAGCGCCCAIGWRYCGLTIVVFWVMVSLLSPLCRCRSLYRGPQHRLLPTGHRRAPAGNRCVGQDVLSRLLARRRHLALVWAPWWWCSVAPLAWRLAWSRASTAACWTRY